MIRYWPLARGTYRVGSPFGPRDGGFHAGQDFPAADGTPFYACAGGTVLFLGNAEGYGEWIVIDHPAADGGGVSECGHMWDARATGLRVGDRVEAGQLLGMVGNNGESSGPHLHLSVMPYGYDPAAKVDPMAWLTGAVYPGQPTEGGKSMDLMPYREQLNGLWSGSDNTRQVIVQHTTESEGGNTNVIGYLEQTRNGSYQTMVDFDGEEVRMVPDDRQAWAAMNAGNRIGLHVCAMGRAAFTRDRWLSETRLLERTAMRYAEWSRLYGIPLIKLNPTDVRAGKRGVCGHADISAAFRESDHTDPGANFPFDVVISRAKQLLDPTQEAPMSAAEVKQVQDFVAGFVGPIGSDVKDLREQACGAGQRDAGQYDGWPQLGGRTIVDALAVIGSTLGIPGFTAAKEKGQ